MNLYYLEEGSKCLRSYDAFDDNIIYMIFPETVKWRKQTYRNEKPVQKDISIPGWNGCEQIKFAGNFFAKVFDGNGTLMNSIRYDARRPMEILRYDQYITVAIGYNIIDGVKRYVPFGSYQQAGSTYQILGMSRTLPEAESYYGGAQMFYRDRETVIDVLSRYGLLSGNDFSRWPGKRMWYVTEFVASSSTARVSNRSLKSYLLSHVPSLPTTKDVSLETRNAILDSAMQSFERLATFRLALELMSDGLVLQASSQLARTIDRLLSTSKGTSVVLKNGRLIQENLSKAKLLSQAYMTYNWGIRAALGDYGKLLSLLSKGDYYNQINNPYLVGRYTTKIREWEVSFVAGCQVSMSEMDSISSTLYFLHKYGYDLTANDIWEVIPLSFAVDWLIDVSDWLDSLERSYTYASFPIRGSWLTLKGVTTLQLTDFYGVGTITYYNRGDMPSRFLPDRDEYRPIFDLTGRLRISNIGDILALGTSFFG